jgi:hypothetical protein
MWGGGQQSWNSSKKNQEPKITESLGYYRKGIFAQSSFVCKNTLFIDYLLLIIIC